MACLYKLLQIPVAKGLKNFYIILHPLLVGYELCLTVHEKSLNLILTYYLPDVGNTLLS